VTSPSAFPSWSDQQRATFYYQMAAVQKDEVLGVLLAVFLGTFGLHHFYLKQNGLGILYLLLFWTGVPTVLGFFEAFFMPGRVRRHNAEQAAYIAASLGPAQGGASPGSSTSVSSIAVTCPRCGVVIAPGAKFCSNCGAASAT
jgi:TM2 domain-containing membrane protein YozV